MARAPQEFDACLHDLIESNQRFVAKVAHALRHRAVPFEDLMSEGNLGLIEAARRYDRARGTGFLTYAVWWIRKRMLAAIASQQSLVRIRRRLMAGWSESPHGGAKGRAPEPPSVSGYSEGVTSRPGRPRTNSGARIPEPSGEMVSTA